MANRDEFEYTCSASTSAYWTSTPGPYIICPGWSEDYACVAELDNGVCRDGPGDLCDCEAGSLFCDEGINLCWPECPAFVHSRGGIIPGAPARPIGCEDGGGRGTLGASRAYNGMSCCSSDAVHLINTRQWSGGFRFDIRASGSNSSDPDSLCGLYALAMTSVICDPNLGKYVRNHTLKVCLSSCEELYNACGSPGENLPANSTYTDAIGLCSEAWGGFESPASDSPCDYDPDGFACISGIHRVEVAEAGEMDCLGFTPPTQNEIDHHLDENVPLDGVCPRSEISNWDQGTGRDLSDTLFFVVIFPLVFLANLARRWLRKRGMCGAKSADQDAAQETSASPDAPQVASTTTATLPLATPVPIGSASASDPPAPDVPPAPAAAAAASLATVGTGVETKRDSDDPDLTFDQRMDLRFLEGKLQMEMITPGEYEEKKKEILSS